MNVVKRNHGRLTSRPRCSEDCNGFHVNADAERIERCDACAALMSTRLTDRDAASFVLTIADRFVCESEDGEPITLHSCARRTLARRA